MKFASLGPVYDIIHLPGNFEVRFARPEAALKLELEEKFPASSKDIGAFLGALGDADSAGRQIFAQRSMPTGSPRSAECGTSAKYAGGGGAPAPRYSMN